MNLVQSAYCAKEELEQIKLENKKVYWSTDLLHINSHCGLRKDKIHVLMGPTHSAKTTLTLRVAVDNAKAGARVLFWASEDGVNDVRLGLSRLTTSKEILSRIGIMSELDFAPYTENARKDLIPGAFFSYMSRIIKEGNYDQVYIDNLTTSSMYADLIPSDQARMAMKINRIAIAENKSFYIVMHTRKGVTNDSPKPISVTDIAGSEMLPRLAQFLYIIQQFSCKNDKLTILKIEKNRGFELKDNYYVLDYHNKQIVQDRKISFNLFLDIFQKRQRLYENFNPNSDEDVRLVPFLTMDEIFEIDREKKEKVIEIKPFKKIVENRNLLD